MTRDEFLTRLAVITILGTTGREAEFKYALLKLMDDLNLK